MIYRAAAAFALAAIVWQLPASPAGAQERLTREALAGADYVRGRLAFQQRCSACHTLAEDALHLAGPNLWEVIGRTAGTREEFSYSETLREAEFAWTPDRVDEWLANPDDYLPGNTMLIPEPVPDRDRLPMISFMMMETGGADWPRPEIDIAALETPRGESPAERFPSFWNHLMHNTTRYRWVDDEQEFVFDAYYNKDGSVTSSMEGVDGFWHIDERDFFCYALQGAELLRPVLPGGGHGHTALLRTVVAIADVRRSGTLRGYSSRPADGRRGDSRARVSVRPRNKKETTCSSAYSEDLPRPASGR